MKENKEGSGSNQEQKELKRVEENAEKIKLPPALLVYRDNDVYGEYIPEVVHTIREISGREVKTKVFPRGTDEKEILQWAEGHKGGLDTQQIFSDHTFLRSLKPNEELEYFLEGSIARIDESHGIVESPGYLDGLFFDATSRVVLGRGSEEKEPEDMTPEKKLERFKDGFTRIISQILKNKESKPSKVIVVEEELDAHHMWGHDSARDPEESLSQRAHRATGIVKAWLMEAGIAEDTIEIVEKSIRGEMEKQDRKGTWIIADRHTNLALMPASQEERRRMRTDIIALERAKLLELPLENLFISANRQGLIEIEPGEMKNVLTQILEEDFDPEAEKNTRGGRISRHARRMEKLKEIRGLMGS